MGMVSQGHKRAWTQKEIPYARSNHRKEPVERKERTHGVHRDFRFVESARLAACMNSREIFKIRREFRSASNSPLEQHARLPCAAPSAHSNVDACALRACTAAVCALRARLPFVCLTHTRLLHLLESSSSYKIT
ncbi:hypothetical protein Q3G72_028382 [Acer saccharum]|nr:hypothetical protein Q3G72_028382 [Acer saccharum]